MRDIDATFTDEKNSEQNKPIRLYTIHDYDSDSNDLNYAEYDDDVPYDGVTYSKFPLAMEGITENNSGEIDAVIVKVSNVNRVIQSYLETYDLRNKKVTIKTVWADQLADTTAFIDDIFYIDSYSVTEQVVAFTLKSKFDVLDVSLPGRIYSRNYCSWDFKSTECGYAGAEATCNKTLAQCRTYLNVLRFGGFPSIPQRRLFV